MKRIDIDATSRCTLKCPACMRQNYYGVRNKPVPGKDISVKDFQKIVDHFDDICLIGNLSDPTTHPKLYTLLKMCVEKDRSVILSVASSNHSFASSLSLRKASLYLKANQRFAELVNIPCKDAANNSRA